MRKYLTFFMFISICFISIAILSGCSSKVMYENDDEGLVITDNIVYKYANGGYWVEDVTDDFDEKHVVIPTVYDDGKNGKANVTIIVGKSFDGENIESVRIPRTVSEIGPYAFRGSSLTNVVIPESVEALSANAFYQSRKLASVTYMGDNPPVLELYQDLVATHMESIRIFVPTDSVQDYKDAETWGDYTDYIYPNDDSKYVVDEDNIVYNSDKTEVISVPIYSDYLSYTLPSSVTKIGDYAFHRTSMDLTLDEGVVTIGKHAFDSFNGEVNFSNTVTTIEEYAFYMSIIDSIELPNSVIDIGNQSFGATTFDDGIVIGNGINRIHMNAFENNYSNVSINADVPPIIYSDELESNDGSLSIVSGCLFYVPTDSLNDYKTAVGWEDSSMNIYALSD